MIELNSGNVEPSVDFQAGYDGSTKQSFWSALASWDKLLLVLALISFLSALAAVVILLTPVMNKVVGFMGLQYAAWSEWQAWIVEGDRGLMIGAALGLFALLFAFLARYRLIRNYSVYVEAGCPQCHEQELIRVRRNRKDRALGKLGLPVRRYSCRNCTWHGLRLAGYRYRRNFEETTEYISEDFEVDAQQAEVEIIEDKVDSEFEFDTGAETQALTGDTVAVAVEEPLPHLVEEPIAASAEAAYENGGRVEQFTLSTSREENLDNAEVDEEAAYQAVEDEPARETADQDNSINSETEQQQEVQGVDPGSASEGDGDDFERLCLEVALSK